MADVKNDWLGYLDRSYSQIKTSLLSRVTSSNPELTDHSESNPFIIIISMFSAIAEMLGYYIDNVAQESFLATASRRSSVIKHTRALDYRIRARNPEEVDLVIQWNQPVPSNFTLSAGFYIESIDGIPYILLVDQQISAGVTFSTIPISQVTEIDNATYAVTNGQKNQEISLGSTYDHKSSQIFINSVEYFEQDTFAFSGSTSKHYIIEIKEDGNAYIVLGDGLKGELPLTGLTIRAVYRTTLGPDGKVGAGNFDDSTIVLNSTLPGTLQISSANSLLASSGGSFYEETEAIRNNAIRSIRTLDRMVNRQDHKDIMENVAGVAKAEVNFCCGKNIDLYIVPDGGGVASSSLITAAQAEADDKKMVATFPVVKAAGETELVIKATVTAKKRKSLTATKTEVENALVDFGSVTNQEINGAIRLSDLQALIDNLTSVEFVELTSLYTQPYARPIGHINNLNWVNETKEASVSVIKWRLEYDGANIRIHRDGQFITQVAIGTPYTTPDNIFTFTVNAGSYVAGNYWEFNTYPFLKNIQLVDFTIFSIKLADLYITVIATPVQPPVIC